MYFMGIDIGTSSTKAAIFSETGRLVSLITKPYHPEAQKPGFAEQEPEIWWQAVISTIKKCLADSQIKAEEILAIGFSGQMHGTIPLDASGKAVRKAILHCDVRAKDTVLELQKQYGTETISDIVLNPLFPGFQLLTLCWMRKNEPELFRQVKLVICPKDYIRYKLTGSLGVEHTDASGTLLYDMNREQWSEDIFQILHLDSGLVPDKIHSSFDVAGTLCANAAEATGLSEKTLVVYGGADQAMHSLGNGVYKPGTMMATIGTSGQVLTVSEQPVKNPKWNTHFFRHVNMHSWYGMAAVLHAGSTLNWFRRNFAKDSSYEDLSRFAEQISPCCDGLVFLPCMGGERTPYMDSETRGIFSGISMSHGREHFARAIMEGVTFAMKTGIEKMNQLYGRADRLICAGGGVKGRTWAQIQADIYGREIYISGISEQACLGAAITAAAGSKIFQNLDEACDAMIQKEDIVIEPDREHTKRYEAFYQEVYAQLYEKNRELFYHMNHF
ncbi:MAG: xylulokinase [Lachnospiraceae bacterium]|jgi:xylulokinase|nr:xylulokinase [Lachnospiraceae bacterium]